MRPPNTHSNATSPDTGALYQHELVIGDRSVATYVLDETRPYLHPIRTLSGVVITDLKPEDHVWHWGLSLAVQDVNGTNLWGGRTYVRGQGYTWRDDHGRISHEGFDVATPELVVQHLAWRDKDGGVLLHERRTITASAVDDLSWQLRLAWDLTAPSRVVLGSPTTNGRELGAGYGGCFLRLANDPDPVVTAGNLRGEEEVNGCAEPTVQWDSARYRIEVSGASRWFVRTGIYPGLCAAWAYDKVHVIEAGETWSGQMTLTITDR